MYDRVRSPTGPRTEENTDIDQPATDHSTAGSHQVAGGSERALASCQPLVGLFEEVERRGLDPSELVGDVPHTLAFLRNRRHQIPWNEFISIIDRLTEHYDDGDLVDIGRQQVHTEAQRPFGLIATRFFSIADFYRAVFSARSGWGRTMFPFIDSTFAELDEGVFEATLTFHDGVDPSHAFALITKGNVIGMPEVLGSAPAEVVMETNERGVRYEITASPRTPRLARLRSRLSLPFRADEMATELREAHSSLRTRYDALQEALHDREQTTAALRASEARLRLMLDSAEMAIWDWDLAEYVVTLDEVGQELLGLDEPVTSITADHFLTIVHEEDRSKVLSAVEASIEAGASYSQLFRICHHGAVRTLEAHGHVFRDASGEPVRFIGVAQDVTEELRRTERFVHLGRVVASSPLEIYVLDVETQRFIDANEIACENLGYTEDEVRALDTTALVDLDDGAEVMGVIEPLLAGERDRVFTTVRHRRKDGSTYPIDLSLQTSTLDSRPVLLGIGADVTERVRAEDERRELEAQLWRAQKLEALGTLASGITHDFNNVLMTISGYTELALQSISPDSPEATHLDRVRRAADRGKSLAAQVLTFSRASNQPRSCVELGPVVDDSLELLRATLPATVEIRSDVVETGCVVDADAGQIGQIVTNLCTNAAHASTDTGATIDVRLERLDLEQDDIQRFAGLRPGPHACLTVRDHGVGMEPDVMERIFDPFFTTKDLEGGTGLGLAVVHGIVRDHGGAIDIDSSPGAGTTVSVMLPALSDVDDVPTVTETAASPGTERVLLVDDHDGVAEMLQLGLERFGYRVSAFSTSTDAHHAFERDPDGFDVIVTDQTMPDMTGLELASRVHELRADIPVVLISGLGAPTGEPTALDDAGITEVLMKPFGLDELSAAVARAVERGV